MTTETHSFSEWINHPDVRLLDLGPILVTSDMEVQSLVTSNISTLTPPLTTESTISLFGFYEIPL